MSTNGERDGVNTSRLLAKRLRGWLAPGMSRRDGAIGGCRGGGPVKCAHLGPKPPPSDAIPGRMSDSITVDVDVTEVKITHPDTLFFSARGETKLDLVRYYQAVAAQIGRAHVRTPVTNAQLVCRLLLEKK